MPASEQDLFARLAELGVETTTVRHRAVFTVEESKAHRGDLPGGHTKNLFLKDKKGVLWLVVALEDRAIDLKELRHPIGAAPLSFGRPELLREVLGIDPGSVTPFALINDTANRVNVVLDAEMMSLPLLNVHPLTNTATSAITPAGLAAFIRSCGHDAKVVALEGPIA
ncbi:MAG: prolyl-tRNA synthetase associated domain-containing protein [Rhodospirillales bacterium]